MGLVNLLAEGDTLCVESLMENETRHSLYLKWNQGFMSFMLDRHPTYNALAPFAKHVTSAANTPAAFICTCKEMYTATKCMNANALDLLDTTVYYQVVTAILKHWQDYYMEAKADAKWDIRDAFKEIQDAAGADAQTIRVTSHFHIVHTDIMVQNWDTLQALENLKYYIIWTPMVEHWLMMFAVWLRSLKEYDMVLITSTFCTLYNGIMVENQDEKTMFEDVLRGPYDDEEKHEIRSYIELLQQLKKRPGLVPYMAWLKTKQAQNLILGTTRKKTPTEDTVPPPPLQSDASEESCTSTASCTSAASQGCMASGSASKKTPKLKPTPDPNASKQSAAKASKQSAKQSAVKQSAAANASKQSAATNASKQSAAAANASKQSATKQSAAANASKQSAAKSSKQSAANTTTKSNQKKTTTAASTTDQPAATVLMNLLAIRNHGRIDRVILCVVVYWYCGTDDRVILCVV
ncbi:hypothetical protein SEMRO_1434_G272310.1 [Seminavis robusta]|uniref:Uncharacterized protein n=1 Tax=Seminavis robusta TaxID=568900 RepID=A0A9N8HSV6_9STRA|nr:hypothetical protein SEMRO_1434_G272310.1 [Seminavis robusta]|eukprot:Sro1434_g272310.1 n/a (465) ;mRNA; f:16146-17540